MPKTCRLPRACRRFWEDLWPLVLVASGLAIGCGAAHDVARPTRLATPASGTSPSIQTGKLLDALRERLSSGRGEVRDLNLAAKGYGPGLGSLLAEATSLSALTSLDVSDNALGADGARALSQSPNLTGVRDLDLGGNDIADDGAEAIAHASAFLVLDTLNVSGNSITSRGASSLVLGNSSRLSSIDLSMNDIGEAGAIALSRGRWPLRSLYLLGCEIGPAGAQALAQSKQLATLEVLALTGNSLGDSGAQFLADSTTLQNLTTLDLCANGIGDAGALALAQSRQFKKLRVLELYGNEIAGRGAAALRLRFGTGLHL